MSINLNLFQKFNFKLKNYIAFIIYYLSIKSKAKKALTPKIIHIVFSFDRALQLDNYIRSFKKFCGYDLDIDFYVLYKNSSILHRTSYEKLKKSNKDIYFVEEKIFKRDINNILKNYKSNEILSFGVDDIEFIRNFSLKEVYKSLNYFSKNKKKVIFSLRHGTNLKKSVQCNLDTMKLPKNLSKGGKYIYWDFNSSEGDWGYPLAVDCHFYPIDYLKTFIKFAYFKSPNSLEASLQILKKEFNNSIGISYSKSICFNNPNNRVQNEFFNYSLNSNTDSLAKKYLEGFFIKQKEDILRIQISTHLAYSYELTREGE